MEKDLTKISGIGESAATLLNEGGYSSIEAIAESTIENLAKVRGFSIGRAEKVINLAKEILSEGPISAKNTVADDVAASISKENATLENVKEVKKGKDKKFSKNKGKKKEIVKGKKKGKQKDKKKDKKKGKKKDKKKGKKKSKKKGK